MTATRLLVVADPRMLTSLAQGLREGGRFEIATASLQDPAAATAAAEAAEGVVVFYAGPQVVSALSARLRERGTRVVAVVQKDQLALRDECLKAGAGDVVFMPLPKDQFVSRLEQAFSSQPPAGASAQVDLTVAARGGTARVAAQLSAQGLLAEAELPARAGETVRLAWGGQKAWGLVLRAAAPAQVRFAGLSPDEEEQIRKTLAPAAEAAPVANAPAAAAPAASTAMASTSAPIASAPAAAAIGSSGDGAASAAPAAAVPAAGPPPGFADRPPVRPVTRQMSRPPPPVMAANAEPGKTMPPAMTGALGAGKTLPPGMGAPLTGKTLPPGIGAPLASAGKPAAAGAPSDAARPAAPLSAPGTPGVAAASDSARSDDSSRLGEALFAEAPAAEAQPAPSSGPAWPVALATEPCRTAALQLLVPNGALSAETPAPLAASARKVTFTISAVEREAITKAGPESHFADALAARIALDAATSEGQKLTGQTPAPAVDAVASAALLKLADEAAARLQKEANAAVTKGEVETLQLLSSASAALSRDVLAFKEVADRLRGIEAAPRLGAGALDPDMLRPGQISKPVKPTPTVTQPVRAELKEFASMEEGRPGKGKTVLLIAGAVAFLALAANAIYFSLPHPETVAVSEAGSFVQAISVSGGNALVVVTQEWVDHAEAEAPKLFSVLREHGAVRGTALLPNGRVAANLDLQNGKLTGLAKPTPPKK